MATLNVRLDDKLKKEAYAVLEKHDMTPTEAVRLLFQYIAENGRMQETRMTTSDGVAALLRPVGQRTEKPRPGGKVSTGALWTRSSPPRRRRWAQPLDDGQKKL
ncbi:hypothetical protein G6X41_01875, partial [Staphylococcus aureus]|nr:hypothetical protein [Staphylococcus aureus]